MNTLLLSMLALLALTSVALGIVCTDDICDNVKCAAVTEENCAYTVVPNGGFCECCDACVHILEKGEDCPTMHVLGGGPQSVRCGDALFCNGETGKCESQ